jgi:thioredoxin
MGRAPLRVEVFSSPGRDKCARAKEELKRIAVELGGNHIEWREVSVLDELDYAVELGVLATPATAVNGRLVFSTLPSASKLRAALEDEIRRRYSKAPDST